MKGNNKRLRFAQNRIDYIVYGNPKGVADLVYDYGYEPPESPHDLVKATKILIRKKGRKVVKDLIKIHPDRKAFLKIKRRGKEDHFCGACNSYSYNPEDNFCGVCGHSNYNGEDDRQSFLNQLTDMGLDELEGYYENLVGKANETPDNANLAEEVQLVWNELRQRKAEQKKETQEDKPVQLSDTRNAKEGLIILGLAFIAGVLVGSSSN